MNINDDHVHRYVIQSLGRFLLVLESSGQLDRFPVSNLTLRHTEDCEQQQAMLPCDKCANKSLSRSINLSDDNDEHGVIGRKGRVIQPARD